MKSKQSVIPWFARCRRAGTSESFVATPSRNPRPRSAERSGRKGTASDIGA